MSPYGIGFMSWSDLGILAVVVIVFIMFLKDFDMTSKKSWVVLLGLTVVGGLTILRSWRHKQLLKELEAGEKAMKEMEGRYRDAEAQLQITTQAFDKARADMDRASKDHDAAMLEADRKLKEALEKIRNEYSNLTPEQLILKVKQQLAH